MVLLEESSISCLVTMNGMVLQSEDEEARCNKVVDKYIEYDPVIIMLDALLLKRPAYRHILFNTKIQHLWKLTLVLLLCESFIKLVSFKKDGGKSASHVQLNEVFYSALELDLYWNFFLSVLELAYLITVLLLQLYLFRWHQKRRKLMFSEVHLVCTAIILSGFGHILVLLPILWGQSYSAVYFTLNQIFVILSNIQALRVIFAGMSAALVSVMVMTGYATQLWLISSLPSHCPTFL